MVSPMDRLWNEEVRRRVGMERTMAEVTEGRIRGGPRLGWFVDVKVVFGSRGMTVKAA